MHRISRRVSRLRLKSKSNRKVTPRSKRLLMIRLLPRPPKTRRREMPISRLTLRRSHWLKLKLTRPRRLLTKLTLL